VSGLLGNFYDMCDDAIWEHDGLLNKTIGDAIMAIFSFPIRHDAHAERAVLTARQIQREWRARREALPADAGNERDALGVGIDTGKTSFGQSHRDLTALGAVVNTAARAQSAAKGGKILVTQAVLDRAGRHMTESAGREYRLKGFDRPVTLCAA
jgi:class 3 adenylate cyclase